MRSVLVVDDDRDICEAIGTILSEEGYDVRTAFNGLDALRLMGDRTPDLLLLDLMMPVMDGWQVMRVLRADKQLRAVTYLFLPGWMSPWWVVLNLYWVWLLGRSLETEWGAFKLNIYYLLGMLGTTFAALLAGEAMGNFYLNATMLFAVATIAPNHE